MAIKQEQEHEVNLRKKFVLVYAPITILRFSVRTFNFPLLTSLSALFGTNQFPRFQKNYWYEYSTPPSTTFPGKQAFRPDTDMYFH